MEPGAHGEMLSMAFAGPGQTQDAGSKMMHFAPNTTSKIVSKSISKGGGRTVCGPLPAPVFHIVASSSAFPTHCIFLSIANLSLTILRDIARPGHPHKDRRINEQ